MPYRLAPAVRVAVLGSCVSRDLFNSRFNPHYKDLFECVALSNQVSLISLMSPAVDVPRESISELDDYSRREVVKEISRSFLQELIDQWPDYLLVDMFADVHFGCFAVDGRYLTQNRWKIMNTRFYAEATKQLLLPQTDRPAYLRVWNEAVSRLFAFLEAQLPQTRVVLHRARNVTSSITATGERRSLGQEGRLLEMNEWWQMLDDELARRGVDRELDLFTSDLTSSDSHAWGPFAVHYTGDYHSAALSKLTQIVLTDARAVPDGRPTSSAGPKRLRTGRGSNIDAA